MNQKNSKYMYENYRKCLRLILRNVQVIQYKIHNIILVHVISREFIFQNKKCLGIKCSPDIFL